MHACIFVCVCAWMNGSIDVWSINVDQFFRSFRQTAWKGGRKNCPVALSSVSFFFLRAASPFIHSLIKQGADNNWRERQTK
mmetsp:Transcript_25741/g.50411  ORF Transcript_25741/g.50411 Transcript_25741/m.50411 type:complete len:81 (+) Transcript_25741:721-963(+)